MLVGYARTSSLAQVAGLEAQERELRTAGCDKIFAEQVSSVAQREQLEAALDYVREGDTFTVTKLDRLARSVGDLLEIVARLEAKKVLLRVLAMSGAEPLDTGTAIGRLMLAVIGAVGRPSERPCSNGRGRASPKPSVRAAIRAVCRPLGARLMRSSGSRRKASGPLKSPAGWGSAGRACIGCLVGKPPVSVKKLLEREPAQQLSTRRIGWRAMSPYVPRVSCIDRLRL